MDVVVSPDRSWHWKDENEFAHHLAHPDAYWVDDAEAVHAAGERAIKLVETGEFPFDGHPHSLPAGSIVDGRVRCLRAGTVPGHTADGGAREVRFR